MFYLSLFILAGVFGTLIFQRPFLVKYLSLVVFAVLTAVFSWLVFLSIELYRFWQGDHLGRYLLPPYARYDYFLLYVFFRFFLPYLISLSISGLFVWIMNSANRKFGGRFFEKEELGMAFLAIFLAGHPGWIIYFIFLCLSYLLWHLCSRIKGAKNIRLPLYYLWIPVGILVILINNLFLSDSLIWQMLKI